MKTKIFIDYALTTICTFGTLGIAIKLIQSLNKWIFLPFFPDILDFAFLILSVAYLTLRRRW